MADETKPKSYEERVKENSKKDKERIERIEKVRIETKERFDSNPAVFKYFEKYNKSSVESFIEDYAHTKSLYMEYGERFGTYNDSKNMSYYDDAYECLAQIQHKKLFDLRCQWGANKIALPGIEISWDFYVYSDNDILNCPLLPHITQEEFELYMRYAASEQFERENPMEWRDFIDERNYENDEDEDAALPEWFYYHNIHTGSDRYLALPDLRGAKEEFYRGLVIDEREVETERKYASGELKRPPAFDNRPWLYSHHYSTLSDFVKQFEDAATFKKFISFEEFNGSTSKNPHGDDDYLDDQSQEAVSELGQIYPALPIEANDDWRVAVIKTLEKYKATQTIAALHLAYEDYLFHIENNILFERNIMHIEQSKQNAGNVKGQVLRGRELNGEPRDFNF